MKLEFAKNLRELRLRRDLTQDELAEQLGVSVHTVSRWERENRTPHLAMVGQFYSFCMRNGIEIKATKEE